MANFSDYYPLLIANEGGYVFDPYDLGGETWRGISRVYNPQWKGWPLVDAYKARADWPPNCRVHPRNKLATDILKKDKTLAVMVRAFYQAEYWDSLHLSELTNQCIASQLCDIGVNSGVVQVGRLAQFVLASSFGWKGDLDGILGPVTRKAINHSPAKAYYEALVVARRSYYRYRAGQKQDVSPEHASFLQRIHVGADTAMQRFLPSWLNRIDAIPFTA